MPPRMRDVLEAGRRTTTPKSWSGGWPGVGYLLQLLGFIRVRLGGQELFRPLVDVAGEGDDKNRAAGQKSICSQVISAYLRMTRCVMQV